MPKRSRPEQVRIPSAEELSDAKGRRQERRAHEVLQRRGAAISRTHRKHDINERHARSCSVVRCFRSEGAQSLSRGLHATGVLRSVVTSSGPRRWTTSTFDRQYHARPVLVKAIIDWGAGKAGGDMFRHQIGTSASARLQGGRSGPAEAAVIHDLFEDAPGMPGSHAERSWGSTAMGRPCTTW